MSVPFPAYNSSSYKSRQQPSSDATLTRPKLTKENTSDNLLSYYSSSIANEGRDYSRSRSAEKPLSSRASNTHAQKAPATTSASSSSDYSDDSKVPDTRAVSSEASSSVTRRSGTPSTGGADKRRIAIVQMDSVSETLRKSTSTSDTASSSNSVRSRRVGANNLSGLALVAPPDASLRSYTHFTPPSTAPVTADLGHHRSASESPADRSNIPSRDSGTVGAVQGTPRTKTAPFISQNNTRNTKEEDKNNSRYSPLDGFRRSTASRSPSPTKQPNRVGSSVEFTSPLNRTATRPQMMSSMQVMTPSIGEGKQIDMPVAGPVVIKLDNLPLRASHSSPSWRSDSPTLSQGTASNHGSAFSSATSSYLRYEPGVHATAGPLPPPPRAMFNIDIHTPPPPRPPRLHSPTPTPTTSRLRSDIEAVKQALQLPPSVNAVLASKLSTPFAIPAGLEESKEEARKEGESETQVASDESDNLELSGSASVHRREAATLTNSTSDTSSVLTTEDKTSANHSNEAIAVTVVEPLQPFPSPSNPSDNSRSDEWLQETPDVSQQGGRRSTSSDERQELERSLSPTLDDTATTAPSPPPKSLRNSFTNNLKRFSTTLPRTPSMSSRSGNRLSTSTRYSSSSRTPSPSIPLSPPPCFKKIKSPNPAALFCHEVHGQHTTLQRCAIYAAKINELYIHDCGLMEWVDESRTRGSNMHSQRGPSTKPFTPQPRQTSRSSMISDATFPIRPDASVATDLLQGAYRDITPPGMPPLPYPSLAINPPAHNHPTRSQSSASSATPTSSIRSLGPTPSLKSGFFASLGRKASISTGRKDKYLPTISNPIPVSVGLAGRTGLKHSHTSAQYNRPNNSSNPQSVPGGPRAPPNRVQRSQTFMASASVMSPSQRSGNEDLIRRPSLFNLADVHPADTEFSEQVDKLHALLPQADRGILAGYLRHAGQDMLAIGQYLEDERMGTIQRF